MKCICFSLILFAVSLSGQTKSSTDQELPPVVGVPKLAADLKAGTWKYDVKIAIGARTLALKVTTEIKEQNGAWLATETIQSSMFNGTGIATLEKGTLVERKRSGNQGPVVFNLDFAGNKVTGKMRDSGGQERPVEIDLGGAVFADGAGSANSIGSLPLAEGYTTAFRNVDLEKGKLVMRALKVAGSEMVTVPAGKFDTYKVEITAPGQGNETFWIAKDTGVPVKLLIQFASPSGGTMTYDLSQ